MVSLEAAGLRFCRSPRAVMELAGHTLFSQEIEDGGGALFGEMLVEVVSPDDVRVDLRFAGVRARMSEGRCRRFFLRSFFARSWLERVAASVKEKRRTYSR